MNGRQGFLFILPAILVLAAFILYPLGSTLYLSMIDQQGNLVGLDNYAAVLQEPLTARASQNTIYYVGVSTVFEIILGTVAGIPMNQRFRGQGAMRALVLIPWVIPEIVAATVWAWMFHTDFGVINFGLKSIGLIQDSVGWLTNPNTVLPALVAIHVWRCFHLWPS